MPKSAQHLTWNLLNSAIEHCTACPRLRTHCEKIAIEKRAAYRSHTYWSKPVPNLGPHDAHLLILGLAPGAHGANRTGRMFTGDKSGDFLFTAMHSAGFASQPTSTNRDDGLHLIDCIITASAHCAPPDNKPTPEELANCKPFLDQTLNAMPNIITGHGGILVLGKIAFDAALTLYKSRNWLPQNTKRPTFAHGALYSFPAIENQKSKIENPPFLLCSYHPSQQNTFTGKLTPPMLQKIFTTARKEITARVSP